MNILKIKLILRKLNNLVEGIEDDENTVSAIERDLYRSYLTQLYDLSLNAELSREEEEEPVIIFSEEDYNQVKEEVNPVSKVTPVPSPDPDNSAKDPETVNKEESISADTTDTSIESVDNEVDIRDSIKSLFRSKQAVEISDQLSRRPVNDISKAMSINDRMLTINQLFEGNETKFRTTLDKLNTMEDFSEAKQYLMREVAMTNDWDKGERPEAAELFINLVHRKFNN